MTDVEVMIIRWFVIFLIVGYPIMRFSPTYVLKKPSLWARYKQWRLKKYFEKHGGEQNARNYR